LSKSVYTLQTVNQPTFNYFDLLICWEILTDFTVYGLLAAQLKDFCNCIKAVVI